MCHHPYKGDVPEEVDKYLKWRPEPLGEAALLCGHVHEKWKTKYVNGHLMVNVGVDVWDYYPVSIDQIKEVLDGKV